MASTTVFIGIVIIFLVLYIMDKQLLKQIARQFMKFEPVKLYDSLHSVLRC